MLLLPSIDQFPALDAGFFHLRLPTLADAKEYFLHYNDPLIAKFVPDDLIPNSVADAEYAISSILELYRSRREIYWLVVNKETNKMAGCCCFHNFNAYHHRIEIAYDISSHFWRRGIAKSALRQIIQYAFKHMNANRIEANVLASNTASLELLKKLGFTREGILHEYKYFKNHYTDVVMLSKIKEKTLLQTS